MEPGGAAGSPVSTASDASALTAAATSTVTGTTSSALAAASAAAAAAAGAGATGSAADSLSSGFQAINAIEPQDVMQTLHQYFGATEMPLTDGKMIHFTFYFFPHSSSRPLLDPLYSLFSLYFVDSSI